MCWLPASSLCLLDILTLNIPAPARANTKGVPVSPSNSAPSLSETVGGAFLSNPRSVITGVTNSTSKREVVGLTEASAPDGAAEFDWYSATLYDDELGAVEGLEAVMGGHVEEGKGMHGYERGYVIVNESGIVARVLAGGNKGAKPHAWATGAGASAFARGVRENWGPERHHVTRFDSRLDYGSQGPAAGTFQKLAHACVELAEARGLKTVVTGDYLGETGGRTLYVGSRKSDVFVRLYEKGYQLRGEITEDEEKRNAISKDWCRLEVQVRPKHDARFKAAVSTPEEAWGYSKWTQALAETVAGLDVERTTMQHHRNTEDDATFAWMLKQYGPVLARLVEATSLEAVLVRIGEGLYGPDAFNA